MSFKCCDVDGNKKGITMLYLLLDFLGLSALVSVPFPQCPLYLALNHKTVANLMKRNVEIKKHVRKVISMK